MSYARATHLWFPATPTDVLVPVGHHPQRDWTAAPVMTPESFPITWSALRKALQRAPTNRWIIIITQSLNPWGLRLFPRLKPGCLFRVTLWNSADGTTYRDSINSCSHCPKGQFSPWTASEGIQWGRVRPSIHPSVPGQKGWLLHAPALEEVLTCTEACLVPASAKRFPSQGLQPHPTPPEVSERFHLHAGQSGEARPSQACSGGQEKQREPEFFIPFFLTLLNLFGYLNKQKLHHAQWLFAFVQQN